MFVRIFKLFFFLTGVGTLPPVHAQYVYLFDSPQITTTPLTIWDKSLALKTKSLVPHQTDTSLVKFGMVEEIDQSNQPLDLPKIAHPTTPENFFSITYDLGDDNSSLPFGFVQPLPSVAEKPHRNPLSQDLKDGLLSKIEKFLEGFFIFEANASNFSTYAAWKHHYFESLSTASLLQFSIPETGLRSLSSIYSAIDSSEEGRPLGGNNPQGSKLHFNPMSMAVPYPIFSPTQNQPLFSFNPFQQNSFEPLDSSTFFIVQEEEGSSPRHIRSNRQRRAAWNSANTYTWEINDFDPTNTSANPSGLFVVWDPSEELTDFNDTPSDGEIEIYITAENGFDSIAILAYGTTGGNAMNDYIGNNGFHFMTATGWDVNGTVTNKFNLETSGVDKWLNGYDSSTAWGVYKEGNEFYLTYNFSSLNFSPVPEPSTYFMTGALFCLIGCNRTSRQSARKLSIALLQKFTEKSKHSPIKEQIP